MIIFLIALDLVEMKNIKRVSFQLKSNNCIDVGNDAFGV